MAKSKEKSPVVLQVLPELETGGVEVGTVEIATELQKRGIKTSLPPKADEWFTIWIK
ncbi:MAG: hypothetical protein ACLU99_04705 [Alphaproteobacteria bacterium]